VSVPGSLLDPATCSQVNVEGFLNVLLAARDAGVERVVYASSSAVYGESAIVPQVEDVVGPLLSPYAASKATNELYASVFQRAYGLQTVGLRYFNIFGPRQDPNGAYAAVIPRWIANLLANVPCEIFGDGETTRDFCYISDVVKANILAATMHPSAVASVFNIAGGEEISLNTLFCVIRRAMLRSQPLGGAAEPLYAAARPGDIRRSSADIGRARRHLGFEPSYDATAGLDKTLEGHAPG
jgi:UDP-N-acetylglucosamine 4-epimerase